MGGNLTNLVTTFLPLKIFLGIKHKVSQIMLDLKHPVAIPYNKRTYLWYESPKKQYINPHYPSFFSGHSVKRQLSKHGTLDNDCKYDKLPEEFFENRHIKSYRVPFSYWFPLWIKRAWKIPVLSISIVGAVLISVLLIISINPKG